MSRCLFLAALCVAPLSRARAQDWAELRRHDLSEIRVAGDTIWLWSRAERDSVVVGYYLVRPGTEWHRVTRIAPIAGPDTTSIVHLEGGTVLRMRPTYSEEGDTVYASLTLPGGRTVSLRARAPAADVLELATPGWGGENGPPRMSDTPSAWAATTNAYWVGLLGGFSEGFGTVGGLLRVDRATGRLSTLTHEWLADATINAILPIADTLFIATELPAEYGAVGGIGLIAYEPARDRWRGTEADDSLLPNARILALARVGDSLLVSTAYGPALRSLRGGAWSSWHFVPRLADTTVTLELVPRPDSATVAELVATYLWQAGLVVRPADFGQRFARLPAPKRTLRAAITGNPIDALTDTLFLPDLIAVLRAPGSTPRPDVATALGKLDHPRAREAVRSLLTDSSDQVSAAAAISLASRTDPAAQALVTQRLGGGDREVRWAVGVAREVRDPLWVPELVRLAQAAAPAVREAALDALSRYHTPDATRRLFQLAQSDRRARRALFIDFIDTTLAGAAAWSPADSNVARRVVVLALADTGLGTSMTLGAARLAARLRVGPAIPRLIDVVRRSARPDTTRDYSGDRSFTVLEMSNALVSLTGRADAPVDDRAPRFVARTDAFWQGWRASAGSALVQPVPSAAGKAALVRRSPPRPRIDLSKPALERMVARDEAEARQRLAKHASIALRLRKAAAPTGWAALRP